MKKTTIFVPMHVGDAKWIFCDREIAFDQGFLNAEGKILTGYHTAADAIAFFKEKQPQEPFAVVHLSFDKNVHSALSIEAALVGTGSDSAGRGLWTLTRDGSNYLYARDNYELLMEIVPVERTGISLY
jgi:hypothetical protein